MVQRIIITFADHESEKLDALAQRVGLSRNKLVQQIVRKYLGMPSVLKEVKG